MPPHNNKTKRKLKTPTDVRHRRSQRPPGGSEPEWLSLANAVPAAIFIYQGNKNLFVNAAAQALTGYTRKELLAMNFWDVIHPDCLEVVRERGLARQRGEKVPQRYQVKIMTKNGAERSLDFSACLIEFNGKKTVIGAAVDITESRLAEDSLKARFRELQSLYGIGQQILNASDLASVLKDILCITLRLGSFDLGTIRLLEPSSKMMEAVASEGYSDPKNVHNSSIDLNQGRIGINLARTISERKTLVLENVADWVGLGSFKREKVQSGLVVPICAQEQILGTLQLGSRTSRKFDPNDIYLLEAVGNQIGIAVQKARLYDQISRNLRRIAALRDIALATASTLDLRSMLNALMEKIDLLLPYTTVLVWLVNKETGLIERSACWNLDEEEWKGRELATTPPLVKAAIEGKVPVIAKNVQEDPRTLDREFYRKHGLVSYLGVPMLVKGQIVGDLVFLTRNEHEFTSEEIEFLSTLAGQAALAIHNSQLYEQLKSQATELEKTRQMQADFTAMIAHDLRSPLTAVMSGASMVGDGLLGPVNQEQKDWLAKIEANSRSLVTLVDDFLDLSKLEAGRIDLLKEELDIGQLIRKSLETYTILALSKKISFTIRVDPTLPRIQADPRRLDQVLGNLLSNAIKFTGEEGEIEVGANREDSTVKIWVKDSGIGIPHQEISQLFEKYRQTSSGKNSKQKGTGLGLVICKMIAEAHGGNIKVESEPGRGSTFTVRIPIGN